MDLKKKINLVSNLKKCFLPMFYTTNRVNLKTKQKLYDSCHPNLDSIQNITRVTLSNVLPC